ncbi:RNA-directed DNA polymerase, eukaryota, partial [Tanacetum coccineum]
MNVGSLNINGVGSAPKKKWARKIRKENNLGFFGIQESKSSLDDCSFVHSLWGNQNCDSAVKKAQGISGGIIAMWDVSLFKKHKVLDGDEGFIAILGEWLNVGTDCLMVVVYAPQDASNKRLLWT